MKRSFLLVLFTVLTAFFNCNAAEALGGHGRFSVVDRNFKELSSPYIMLNSNEILDPGGSYSVKTHPVVSARKYNITTKTLTDLKSTMKLSRAFYGAEKYDATHVLIFGGDCDGSLEQQKVCAKAAEIYDIEKNAFTRISDTNYEYPYQPKSLLLSDGRVMLFKYTQGEIFNPKTRTFTKISDPLISDCAIELKPNEVLLCKSNFREPRRVEILDLRTNKSASVKIADKEILEHRLGTPVKVSSDTVLFIGAGDDMKEVLKLDINTKELTKHARLSRSLVGHAVLLENGEILFVSGVIEQATWEFFYYSPGKRMLHAVYDYKKNKIYKRRTASYFNWYAESLYPEKNAVYFIDEAGKNNKLRKYSYKVKKETKK